MGSLGEDPGCIPGLRSSSVQGGSGHGEEEARGTELVRTRQTLPRGPVSAGGKSQTGSEGATGLRVPGVFALTATRIAVASVGRASVPLSPFLTQKPTHLHAAVHAQRRTRIHVCTHTHPGHPHLRGPHKWVSGCPRWLRQRGPHGEGPAAARGSGRGQPPGTAARNLAGLPPGPRLPAPAGTSAPPRPRPRPVPVALPGVAHVCVVDLVLVGLLVQEVEHVLDGQRQGRAPVRRAEDGLEEVVHELLQRALWGGRAQLQGLPRPRVTRPGPLPPPTLVASSRVR